MRERPIIFDAESVKAILAGRKTMTRRVIKFPHEGMKDWAFVDVLTTLGYPASEDRAWAGFAKPSVGAEDPFFVGCPYGKPGDRLWVRETFQLEDASEYGLDAADAPEGPVRVEDRGPDWGEATLIPRYRATQPDTLLEIDHADDGQPIMRWRSPLFMPRWTSRITLEVTAVRAERLQDITEADIRAEGALVWSLPDGSKTSLDRDHRVTFARRWDALNAKRGYAWETNPWVWVVSFKRTKEEA